MLFSVNTSTKSYLTLTETRNLTGTRLRLQPVPGVQIVGERVKLHTGKTGEGTRRGGARGNSVKLQFMLQLRSRRSINCGKSSCTGVPFPFPPLVYHCVFFLLEFFSCVLLSERLEQATASPTNFIPILLLSFVSQTVVFKVFDFQLRMFKKFIVKTFTFHNHVPTFKR